MSHSHTVPTLVNVILERDGFISLRAAAASEAVLTRGSVSKHQSDGMTDQNRSVHHTMILRGRLIHHVSFSNSVQLICFVSKSSQRVSNCIYAHVDIINNRVCAPQGMSLWDLLAATLAGPACQLHHSAECFIVRPCLPGDTSTRSGPLFVCVIFIILQ